MQNNGLKGQHVRQPGRTETAPGGTGSERSPTRGFTAPPSSRCGKVFEEVERPALLPLPRERFAFFHEAQRKVNRDGHVEVAKAYYSVPPEYLGREVWARWDARLVRIFNHRLEQIAVHVRHEPGRFSTHGQHIAAEKISGIERGAAYSAEQGQRDRPSRRSSGPRPCSPPAASKARACCKGCSSLAKKHPSEALEKACEIALSHGCFRLRTIRQLLQRKAAKQEPLPFLDEHPLIRPLADYAAIVARAIHRQADRPSVGEGFERHDRTKAKSLTALSQARLFVRKPSGSASAQVRLSLARLHLCRARLRFTGQLHRSSPFLVSPGAIR